jgi:hypothetical protein
MRNRAARFEEFLAYATMIAATALLLLSTVAS